MRRPVDTGDRYTTKIDMWALGIILHQILTNAHPFCEPGQRRYSEPVYEQFLRGTAPVDLSLLMARSSAHVQQVARALLDRNPSTRPNPGEVLQMLWFTLPVDQI